MTPAFAASTQHAKKVLLIEIAGLGDLVHSLPAMWALRQGYKDAELHCLVQEGNASLLRLTPWIDRVMPYRRGELGTIRHHLGVARMLRSQHYDVAIDFMGADYSAVVARLSGAQRRLLRYPGESRRRFGWRWFNTDVMQCSFHHEPMYLQKLRCVQQAGFTAPGPVFKLDHAALPPALESGSAETAGYIHVSPYAKLARKELPPAQMAQLLTRLMQDFPQHRLTLACSNKARERAALDRLLAALPFSPWRVFAGTLDIPQLYALVKGAALHLGGDSGSMHLAWLAGTPSVSWFRHFGDFGEWVPQGPHHALVCANSERVDYLDGIDTELVIEKARHMLQAARQLPAGVL